MTHLLVETLRNGSTPASAEASPDPLVGLWETYEGYYVLRGDDGSMTLGYTPEGAESDPWGWGTYTFDGHLFTFTSGPGTTCGPGVTGIYEADVSQDGEVVTFTVVSDNCPSERPTRLSGEQTRYIP